MHMMNVQPFPYQMIPDNQRPDSISDIRKLQHVHQPGFLFGYGDAEEYADCIRTLAKDPELRRIMGEKNRKRAEACALERVAEVFLAAETLEELPAAAH